MHTEMLHRRARLEEVKKHCVESLKLSELTWEPNISVESICDCIERLSKAGDAIKNQIEGLRIKVSTNSNFFLLPDGTCSVPVNFVE